MKDPALDSIYLPLKVTFGLVPLLAGLDKFFNLLTDWKSYLSPALADMIPFQAATAMMIVGVIEMAVGLAILTKLTRLGAFVAMVWLVAISLNLVFLGVYDIAVRDLALAVGAYVLGKVSELKGLAWLPGREESREILSVTAKS